MTPIPPIKVLTFGSKGEMGFCVEELTHLPDENQQVQQMRALFEMAPEMYNFILGIANDIENNLDIDDPIIVGAYIGKIENQALKIIKQIQDFKGSDVEDIVVKRLQDMRSILGEATKEIPIDRFRIEQVKRRLDNTITLMKGR